MLIAATAQAGCREGTERGGPSGEETGAEKRRVIETDVPSGKVLWADSESSSRSSQVFTLLSFEGRAQPLTDDVREHMMGTSWHEGCPVDLDDLVLLTVAHWTMDGRRKVGEMVVAERVAEDVLEVFEELYEQRFPIERMRRIAHYDGDDAASMSDNNSSAFNCRQVAGTKRWSEHSFGTAIDINPVQNPYVRGDRVEPEAGADYLDRSDVRPGMLVPGPAVDAFKGMGWGWGGDWSSLKDYQHFSESGR